MTPQDLAILDVINCVSSCLTALGTVGATVVSLVLAYGGSRKKLRLSTVASFSTTKPRRLKTIEICLSNRSDYTITMKELSLRFCFSTTSRHYDNEYPLPNESLKYINEDEKPCLLSGPLCIKPHSNEQLTLLCDDGGSEIGESIAKLLDDALGARIRAISIDEAGHRSHGKWKRIK